MISPFLRFSLILLSLGLVVFGAVERSHANQPNYIVIFCDDLGYGDLGCYGSEKIRTPHIDKLAEEGMRFTQFYSSSPVCTPSRASLMTGCYPRRVGMHEDYTGHWVLIPGSTRGLHPSEVTVAESLKAVGYATACIGKWHLGDQPEHLPTSHGFDYYFGIPYSNDMASARRGDPPLPLVEGTKVIEAPVDQTTLTGKYTKQAIKFIEENKEKPFFLYLPHTFPHLPLFASEKFKGKSANGRYGDSVEEIDWSTGEIMKCLERHGLDGNTLVLFTSDNGSNGRNGGSNKPLAGAKGSTMEGGMRVPMIMRWSGKIKPGSVCDQMATMMDVLPTFSELSESPMPARKIDGHSFTHLIFQEPNAKTKYKEFYYYRRRQLQAIRVGDWKYHLPLAKTFPAWTSPTVEGKGRNGKLVNLKDDLKEKKDISKANPEIIRRIQYKIDQGVLKLGNAHMEGSEQRPALTLEQEKKVLRLEE